VGSIAIAVNWRHNHKYTWWPAKSSLRIEAGHSATTSFVAQVDQAHEIEIAFNRHISKDDRQEVVAVEKPSYLNIQWSVSSEGETIAQGACREYLYFDFAYTRFTGRVIQLIFNQPTRQRLLQRGGGLARGVGQFQCRAGVRYDIHTNVITTIESLNQARPSIDVRVNRTFMNRHYQKTSHLSVAGFISLAASIILFGIWSVMSFFKQK